MISKIAILLVIILQINSEVIVQVPEQVSIIVSLIAVKRRCFYVFN